MHDSILVTYASRCGSTREVAEAMAREIAQANPEAEPGRPDRVELLPARAVTSLSGYRAVIVASAVRMGTWLPEAVAFVRAHAAELQKVKTAFVTVHMLNGDDSQTSRRARAAYLDAVHATMTAPVEVFFAGRIELARMNAIDRLISTVMKAKDQDRRDWASIQAWARRFAA